MGDVKSTDIQFDDAIWIVKKYSHKPYEPVIYMF